ncbi:MAG: type II toxin-antitoxin system RelE/ParE family toxin, partial [Eubacterium sp.]|nr:type II toxin-antitoxin system RelE/ParE family toxin [Eubacterium sp.]
MFSVNFYREDDGSKPVADFIRKLDTKMKAKVVSDLHRLEMLGNEARAPLSMFLEDDIFELRSVSGTN